MIFERLQGELEFGQGLNVFEISEGRLLVLEGTGCPSSSVDRGFCSDPPGREIAIAGSVVDNAPDPGEGVPCTFPFFDASHSADQGARIATSETYPLDRLCRPETIPGMFSSFVVYPHPSGDRKSTRLNSSHHG